MPYGDTGAPLFLPLYADDEHNWGASMDASIQKLNDAIGDLQTIVGSGIAAGPSGSIQFNDAGTMAGDASLMWDKTGKLLTIGDPNNLNAFGVLSINGPSPGYSLAITDPDLGDSAVFYTANDTGAIYGPTLDMFRARGTPDAPTAILAGDFLGYVEFVGHDGTQFNYAGALYALATQNWSNGHNGTALVIKTTPPDTITGIEAFRFGSSAGQNVSLLPLMSPSLILNGLTSGSASISVPAVAGSSNPLLLPTSTGSSGQVLATNGGNPQQLSWVPFPSVPPPLWSSLQSAAADLILANAGFNSTFNFTSSINWKWANVALATASMSQSSPILNLSGQYWNGSASAEDKWTIQNVVASGTNGLSVLQFTHTGSAGGDATHPFGPTLSCQFATFQTITCSVNGTPFLTSSGNGMQVTFSNNNILDFGHSSGGALFEISNSVNAAFVHNSRALGVGDMTTHVINSAFTFSGGAMCLGTSATVGDFSGSLKLTTIYSGSQLNLQPTADIYAQLGTSRIFTIGAPGNPVFTLQNQDTATATVSRNSPIQNFNGAYWTGGATALDQWSIQNVVASGTNGASTLNIVHSGSAGVAAVSLPLVTSPLYIGVSGCGFQQMAAGGMFSTGPSLRMITNGAVNVSWYLGVNSSNQSLLGGGNSSVIAWSNGLPTGNPADTSISRNAAGAIQIGTTSTGDAGGGLLAAAVTLTGTLTAAKLVETASLTATSAATAGVTGQIAWDASNIYICTNGGAAGAATWKKAALVAA